MYKQAVSCLNWRVEHGNGKWKYSKGMSKIVKELEIAKNRIAFCYFLLCFI